jgi:DNA (cytosine-5)-methyltransferase 1
MTAYYNDCDKFNCDWLRNLMRDGLIPPGEIDERPIQEVSADDVRGFSQRHWFAGVGGWAYALRLAGWPDDRPVDTGSCPCQPFSLAGKRQGDKDPRHLWPAWFRLLRVCRPGTILGEQVPGAIGHGWLDGVFGDLEGEGYACGAAVLGAHSVGAPHIRQRIFWVAHAPGQRLLREKRTDAAGIAAGVPAKGPQPDHREYYGRRIGPEPVDVPVVDAIPSRLGRSEPVLQGMVRGARANQKGRLHGYGNAIVPELAATFVRAFMGEAQMTAKDNGRGNLFRDYDLELLEEFARNQYRMVQKEARPDTYWLFEECLRQMAKKKGLAPRDRRDYLVETFGFDPERLELAATIRDRHDTTLGLQCMSMEDALGRNQESAGKSDCDGAAPRPRNADDMKTRRYPFHPACLLFPRMNEAELRALADNIKARGLDHDVILHEGKILDGRNRYLACEIAGVEPTFVEWQGKGSPLEWVVGENLLRRHMSSSQRAVVALGLLPLLEEEAKERQRLSPGRGKKVGKECPTFSPDGKASEIAARLTKTNENYVKAAKAIQAAAPELVERIRDGRINIPEARQLARASHSIRGKVLGALDNGGAKKKVSRLIREAIVADRKASARRYADRNGADDDQNILHGDMGLLWERLKDESVKMFLSDPPYAQPELYGRLAELAAAKLAPGGLCLAYCEPGCLIEVTDEMRKYLDYWWCLGVSHTGMPRYVNDRHIQNKWKPIVAFGRAPVPLPPEWLGDFLEGGGRDKTHHRWGQPVSEARYFITRLTEAGDLVVDPFVGGGTIPLACNILGRRWLATEVDAETVAVARKRLADMGKRLSDQRAVASGHGEDGSLDGTDGTNHEPA